MYKKWGILAKIKMNMVIHSQEGKLLFAVLQFLKVILIILNKQLKYISETCTLIQSLIQNPILVITIMLVALVLVIIVILIVIVFIILGSILVMLVNGVLMAL